MSWLSDLLGVLRLDEIVAKYLIGRAKLEEMKRAKVGESVELPAIRTKIKGVAGYWSIPLGPAEKLE